MRRALLSRTSDALRVLALAAPLWMAVPLQAAATPPKGLVPGLMRFEMELGNPDTALELLTDAQTPAVLLSHAEALSLLGLPSQAEQVLVPLLGQAEKDRNQALAMLERGRIALDQQRFAEAASQFQAALPRLSGKSQAEARFGMAEAARLQGDHTRAAAELGKMPEGLWAALGYYNLAMTYAQQDTDPARALVSLRVAASMAGIGSDLAARDMRDRIYLAAGQLSLKAGEADKALAFLDRINLDSYHAPLALYLHGLAHERQKNYRAALQSWHRARKFPLGLEGVSEAHLAMGDAFAAEGFSGQAGEAWLAAIAAFERELVSIDTLAADIRAKGAYAGLVEASRQREGDWFLADSQAVTAPRLAYLLSLSERENAQAAIRDLTDLKRIEARLTQRQRDLEVFEAMLQARLDKVSGQRGTAPVAGLLSQVERLEKRHTDLVARLEAAEAAGEVQALVSGTLAEQFKELEQTERSGTSSDPERLRRLRGALVWQATNEFQTNRQVMTDRLQQIREDIAQARERMEGFGGRVSDAPGQFRDHLDTVRTLKRRTTQALASAQQLRDTTDSRLSTLALAYLTERRERTVALLDQTQQSVARLYEELAVAKHRRQQGGQR